MVPVQPPVLQRRLSGLGCISATSELAVVKHCGCRGLTWALLSLLGLESGACRGWHRAAVSCNWLLLGACSCSFYPALWDMCCGNTILPLACQTPTPASMGRNNRACFSSGWGSSSAAWHSAALPSMLPRRVRVSNGVKTGWIDPGLFLNSCSKFLWRCYVYTEAIAGFLRAVTPSLLDESMGFRTLDY